MLSCVGPNPPHIAMNQAESRKGTPGQTESDSSRHYRHRDSQNPERSCKFHCPVTKLVKKSSRHTQQADPGPMLDGNPTETQKPYVKLRVQRSRSPVRVWHMEAFGGCLTSEALVGRGLLRTKLKHVREGLRLDALMVSAFCQTQSSKVWRFQKQTSLLGKLSEDPKPQPSRRGLRLQAFLWLH